MSQSTPAVAAPVSKSAAIKIVGTVVVISGLVGGLLYSSTKEETAYYKHVDEVVQGIDKWQGKKLQVHGNVVPGTIEKKPGTLDYRFVVESRAPRSPQKLVVFYKGIVPDTFKSDSEVVVTGMLDNQQQLKGQDIQAKCPSRYEGKDGSRLMKDSPNGRATYPNGT
jgi:cytochrome c-type biogenesis protein CcmE